VPLGIVAMFLYSNQYVHLLPGGFVLLSAVMVLIALGEVHGAPIYKSMSAACASDHLCYGTSSSMSLSIASVVYAFVAAIVFVAAVCCKVELNIKQKDTKTEVKDVEMQPQV